MPWCMQPTRRMSLLKSLHNITLCVPKDFDLVLDYWDVRACIGSS